jgi:hypothetical protein
VRVVKRLLPNVGAVLRELAAEAGVMHCDEEAAVVRWLELRGLTLEVVRTDPRRLLAAYDGLDLVICRMLHACILAANAGMPTSTPPMTWRTTASLR